MGSYIPQTYYRKEKGFLLNRLKVQNTISLNLEAEMPQQLLFLLIYSTISSLLTMLRLISAAHEAGQKIVYHTCGGMMPILEDIAAMKPDAMETFTPPAMGGDTILDRSKTAYWR